MKGYKDRTVDDDYLVNYYKSSIKNVRKKCFEKVFKDMEIENKKKGQ